MMVSPVQPAVLTDQAFHHSIFWQTRKSPRCSMKLVFHFNSLPSTSPPSSRLLSVPVVSFHSSPPSGLSPAPAILRCLCHPNPQLSPRPALFSSYLKVSLPCLPTSPYFPSPAFITSPSPSWYFLFLPCFPLSGHFILCLPLPLLSSNPSLLFTSTAVILSQDLH